MRLLTHVPEVLEDLEESLIGLPLKDSTLSLLKDAIFTYYYDNKPLEREPLRTHLVGIGFGESLAMVDEDSIGIHTPFLEEGQKSPCVEEGKRIVEFLQKKETETLLGEAKKDFKESFDASAWTRFRALKKTSNKDD